MIPQSFIQDLLGRVDIVDVVDAYVKLKKTGANYSACCPFHSEKSPSFTVSPTKQFYHCFGCGAHGSAIGFLMEYAGLSYPDAIRDLAGKIGVPVPEEKYSAAYTEKIEKAKPLADYMAKAEQFYREQLKHSPKAIDYLKQRGLTGEIAARFGIGYAPDDWQGLKKIFDHYDAPELAEAGLVIDNEAGRRYDRFRDRIMFPIVSDKGAVIGFGGRIMGKGGPGDPKYLNSPETPLFEKGRELYGLHQARASIRASNTVIVVEGYMDVVALAQFGVGNAVATLGTATTPHHVHKLLRQADRIVYCFDGDNAGRKAAWRALESGLEQAADGKFISFLFLPQEHDPDSYVREFGPEGFEKQVQEAVPLTDFLLRELRSHVDLTSAEGRSALMVEAKPLLQKLNAPLLRLQLTKMLAQATQMNPSEVENLCGLKPLATAPRSVQAPARGGPRRAPQGKTRHLLKLVLQKPAWSARLPLEILQEGSPEAATLHALADAVDHGELPAGDLGLITEFFRGSDHQDLVHQLAGELVAENLDEEHLETEFNDCVDSLHLDIVSRQISQLTARAASLSSDEKNEMLELLALKQRLKKSQGSSAL